ncbi:hypothetical protein O181_112172, partial [Austropuccinia psidii MF-1]|nr:hypothetical protein [Austropuccinia psidii MF-1]
MHASKIKEYHIIISSPKDHHVMNGGYAEKILSTKLKSPDSCKKGPNQKQSHMIKSRGIKVEKDSSHGGPPGVPKVTCDFSLQVLPHFNPTKEDFPQYHLRQSPLHVLRLKSSKNCTGQRQLILWQFSPISSLLLQESTIHPTPYGQVFFKRYKGFVPLVVGQSLLYLEITGNESYGQLD